MKLKLLIIPLFFSLQLFSADIFTQYKNQEALDNFIEKLNSPYLTKSFLNNSPKNNKIHLLKLSQNNQPRPAILLIGDTNPSSPVGSEILLSFLSELIKNEENLKKLLSQYDFYLIPRPFPDSVESFFGKTKYENFFNATPNDADNDLLIDEDGHDDLNNDGFITLMRIEDENGNFSESKESPFLMINEVEATQKKYLLFSEGIDNDKDEMFNEDLPGSVNLNKNFSFLYPYFSKDAGTHQMSEIESKNLADFIFNHPEITLIFSFGDEDNLQNPWSEDGKKNQAKIRTTIYKKDEEIFKKYSELYNKIINPKKIHRNNQNPNGSFAHWVYYHTGKISLCAIPWQIPIAEIDSKSSSEAKEVLWLEKNAPEALIKWTEINHPDFPNKKVEIGGIKPFYLNTPNGEEIKILSEKYTKFFLELPSFSPRIEVTAFTLTKLNNNFARLELKVKNNGNAPLSPKIGIESNKSYPLNISLNTPKNWQFYLGNPRHQVENLQPNEEVTLSWLFITAGNENEISADIFAPQIIKFSKNAELK